MSKILVDTIDTRSGTTNLTIGSTNSSTVTFENGAVTGHMYPAFEAYRSSNQTPSNNTLTKIQFNIEVYDTDSDYDNSTNHRFTPSVAGKYFVYGSLRGDGESQTDLEFIRLDIYKNGSTYKNTAHEFGATNDIDNASLTITGVVDMNGSTDYLEIFGMLRSSSQPTINGSSNKETSFGAYRIGT